MADDELWDLTDADGAPLGRLQRRGDAMPAGVFHIVASVCVVRGDGLVLMTRWPVSRVLRRPRENWPKRPGCGYRRTTSRWSGG